MATEILDDLDLEASLRNVLEQDSLRWVFVGGKGGVGKTTTSCSVAVQFAARRRNVLLISTDPAHNLSDAFSQRFSAQPTQVNGFDNLFAMEIDPSMNSWLEDSGNGGQEMGELQKMVVDMVQAIPGIDEAMSFAELMRQVDKMEYDMIVFDTAPTGHTLRLLGIPATLETALGKILALKSRFSGLFAGMQGMMGVDASDERIAGKIESAKEIVEKVNRQFMDADKTTFICVCIPEFLSVYETERLVQELANFGIDVHNIVINQVLIPGENDSCGKCKARVKMQKKYIEQVYALYDIFNVTIMPLLDEEVRGTEGIRAFSRMLVEPIEYDPSK